jgi:CheY-like chemotaxis protein
MVKKRPSSAKGKLAQKVAHGRNSCRECNVNLRILRVFGPCRDVGGSNVKACILLVGDDPVLQRTRAELLRDWQITAVNSREAAEAMRARNYDLLILSQTVREPQARKLIAQARDLVCHPRILTISTGADQPLGLPAYQVDLCNPGGLRSAVATMLEARPT